MCGQPESQREWWLFKYAETGRSPSTQGEKRGNKENRRPSETDLFGCVLTLHGNLCQTWKKPLHDLIMFSGCSWLSIQAKVHVNALADLAAPWCKILKCFPSLHPSNTIIITSSHCNNHFLTLAQRCLCANSTAAGEGR